MNLYHFTHICDIGYARNDCEHAIFLSSNTPLKRLSAVVLKSECCVAVRRLTERVPTKASSQTQHENLTRSIPGSHYVTQCFVIPLRRAFQLLQWLLHRVHLLASARRTTRQSRDRPARHLAIAVWQHRHGLPVLALGNHPRANAVRHLLILVQRWARGR